MAFSPDGATRSNCWRGVTRCPFPSTRDHLPGGGPEWLVMAPFQVSAGQVAQLIVSRSGRIRHESLERAKRVRQRGQPPMKGSSGLPLPPSFNKGAAWAPVQNPPDPPDVTVKLLAGGHEVPISSHSGPPFRRRSRVAGNGAVSSVSRSSSSVDCRLIGSDSP